MHFIFNFVFVYSFTLDDIIVGMRKIRESLFSIETVDKWGVLSDKYNITNSNEILKQMKSGTLLKDIMNIDLDFQRYKTVRKETALIGDEFNGKCQSWYDFFQPKDFCMSGKTYTNITVILPKWKKPEKVINVD